MEQGAVLAGRYRLDRQLGGGGMGEVWQGFDQTLRRRVAVKLIRAELRDHAESSEQALRRFRREAEAAAGLNHRNITTVHDYGEHPYTDRTGRVRLLPFLVLEFLDGGDLGTLLARAPAGLPIDQVVEYGIQVCDGLAQAHQAGVVHRDIKPANLMLVADGTVKICDFGIACLLGVTLGLTGHGRVVGTPGFMAPEQHQGLPVDYRADLYALGATLYRLLTGKIPTIAPPGAHRAGISAELDALISALLAENPEQRPASAVEVADRLHRISRRVSGDQRPEEDSQARPVREDTRGGTVPGTTRGHPQQPRGSSRPPRVLTGHTGWVRSVAFAPQPVGGRLLLASAGWDKMVRLWDAATGDPVGQPLTGHTGAVSSVAFAPHPVGGRFLLASASDRDSTVRLWDAATGDPIGRALSGHFEVSSVAFAPQPVGGRFLLASASNESTVRLWDAATGDPIGRPLTIGRFRSKAERGLTSSLAFAPHPVDGRLLLASGSDGTRVRLWDAATGRRVGRPLSMKRRSPKWPMRVSSVAFAPQPVDGRFLLASGADDSTVRLWDAATGDPIGRPLTGHTRPVRSVAFAPQVVDGRLLVASGSNDKTVRIWDAATGRRIGQLLTGHTGGVLSVAFAPQRVDGPLLLVSGANDSTVRIWEL